MKKDRCNICSKMSELTWDHVPPKFCSNDSAKDYMVAFGMMDKNNYKKNFPYITQNGIKFRSICSDCNNRLLGTTFDPEYKLLVDELFLCIQSKLILPNFFTVAVRPNKLARAVVGHMLAAKNFFDDECKADIELRKYFLDTNKNPPEGMQLYYFLYPFEASMVVRDVYPVQIHNVSKEYKVPSSVVGCIYSLPIAFLLTQDCTDLPFENLFNYCNNDISTKKSLAFSKSAILFPGTQTFRNPFWPCNISDTFEGPGAIIAGKSSEDVIMAINRDKKEKISVNRDIRV